MEPPCLTAKPGFHTTLEWLVPQQPHAKGKWEGGEDISLSQYLYCPGVYKL